MEINAAMVETSTLLTWEGRLASFSIQELALVAFLEHVFECGKSNSRPVSRADAQAKRAHYLNMAARIRDDVERSDILYGPLVDAIFEYEQLADSAAPAPDNPLFVERVRKGNERHTGFVIELVTVTAAIFGSRLYGIVAIVTNVVFDCEDWTAQRVRKVTNHTLPLISSFCTS
jgi:hypothetical protein